MILILEDDDDRVRRFGKALRRERIALPVVRWRDARVMAAEAGRYLPSARLISLDHDLEPESATSTDPGDGRMVVQALIKHRQPCPLIIHSSNGTRADWMMGDLELAGWACRRVAPIGERWIEEYWRLAVRHLLAHENE